MSRARRAAPRRRRLVPLTTAVTGAVIVAVIAVVAGQHDAERSASQPAASSGSGASTSIATVGAVLPAEATACATELAAAAAVVGATRIAARHWQQHVQAWTDLLVNKSTEAATRRIFTETTQAGPDDMKRLAEVDAAYAQHRGACQRLTGPSAVRCRQRLAALNAAAVPGHGASSEWRQHLAAMAASVAGKVNGSHARHAWEVAHRTAPKNLHAFATADAALARVPACDLA